MTSRQNSVYSSTSDVNFNIDQQQMSIVFHLFCPTCTPIFKLSNFQTEVLLTLIILILLNINKTMNFYSFYHNLKNKKLK